jgi:hypothetical protein
MRLLIMGVALVGVIGIGLLATAANAQNKGARFGGPKSGWCPDGTYSASGTRWANNTKNCSAQNSPGQLKPENWNGPRAKK